MNNAGILHLGNLVDRESTDIAQPWDEVLRLGDESRSRVCSHVPRQAQAPPGMGGGGLARAGHSPGAVPASIGRSVESGRRQASREGGRRVSASNEV